MGKASRDKKSKSVTVKLQAKKSNEHRWIGIGTFSLTAGQAAALSTPGNAVNLDNTNLVSINVGCLDCEAPWNEAKGTQCLSPAAPEFDDVTLDDSYSDMPGLDKDRLLAAVDLLGRTGATEFNFGYLHDDVPIAEAGWYAHVQYQGARIIAEASNPMETVDVLLRRVITGGICIHCHRTTILGPADDIVDASELCVYYLEGKKWKRGCE